MRRDNKEVQLFFDRNLLSSLLKLVRFGHLKDFHEQKQIALIMLWAQLNDIPISAVFAIRENAFNLDNSLEARIELNNFTKSLSSILHKRG